MLRRELFGSQGYAATSMEQIRRATEISNGSLYHLFPDKVTLAAHLFCAGMQQCQIGLLDAIDHAKSAEQGIRDAVAWQSGWVDANVTTARHCLRRRPRRSAPRRVTDA